MWYININKNKCCNVDQMFNIVTINVDAMLVYIRHASFSKYWNITATFYKQYTSEIMYICCIIMCIFVTCWLSKLYVYFMQIGDKHYCSNLFQILLNVHECCNKVDHIYSFTKKKVCKKLQFKHLQTCTFVTSLTQQYCKLKKSTKFGYTWI